MTKVAALTASVRGQLRYLGKLRARMNAQGFPPGDPLYIAATEAFNAVHALSVALHYLTCPAGTTGPAKLAEARGDADVNSADELMRHDAAHRRRDPPWRSSRLRR